jgi:hypothetical protein
MDLNSINFFKDIKSLCKREINNQNFRIEEQNINKIISNIIKLREQNLVSFRKDSEDEKLILSSYQFKKHVILSLK